MGAAMGFEAIFRWIHVLAGVLWVGLLYFFNFVTGPFLAKSDTNTRRAVVPGLMSRALFWFRWGAVWTWITGFLLLGMVYYQNRAAVDTGKEFSAGSYIMLVVTFLAFLLYDALFKSSLARNLKVASTVAFLLLAVIVFLYVRFADYSYRSTLIHTGAMFGTIMAFNVWFRIWPAQRKLIRAVREGTEPDPELAKLVGMRSRHNAYMSVPLFWAMIGQHTTYFAGGNLGISGNYYWLVWLGIILLGWHIVFHLLKRAAKVGEL